MDHLIDKPPQKRWTVALTGGIASGKSAISRAFAARGVAVYDADVAAREVVAPGQPALAAIVEIFGTQLLRDDGQLDRRALREQIFADADARHRLEAIVHPRVDAWLREHVHDATGPYSLLVIPLLVETWPQYEWVDRIVVVTTPPETQIARLIERDGIDEAAAQRILDAQADDTDRRALANDVITNDGNLETLDAAVDALHHRYLPLARKAGQKRGQVHF